MSWLSPDKKGKKKQLRQVSLFLVVDTSAVFRTFFFLTFNFLKKRIFFVLLIKIWQLLILKMLRGKRVLLNIYSMTTDN